MAPKDTTRRVVDGLCLIVNTGEVREADSRMELACTSDKVKGFMSVSRHTTKYIGIYCMHI